MKAKWSVLALYENEAARALAMQFCDALVQRFWSECSFDLSWCDWAGVEDAQAAKVAGGKAREADLLIMVTGPKGTIPRAVRSWLELALRDREDREGELVGLPVPETGSSVEAAATQVYLRKLAHEAGMDYLTAVPQSLPRRVPESVESYNRRATQVTSVLDRILSHSPPPPRLL